MGSDHCPVWADIKVTDEMKQLMDSGPWPSPQLCSSNYPEFMGRQQSLKAFLSVNVSATATSARSTIQEQTDHVDVQHVAFTSSIISSLTTPAADDADDDLQHDQKSRKQAKLWSFFSGASGTSIQKREQKFQSARELAMRANSELMPLSTWSKRSESTHFQLYSQRPMKARAMQMQLCPRRLCR